jgi:hypothetical protein
MQFSILIQLISIISVASATAINPQQDSAVTAAPAVDGIPDTNAPVV